MLDFSRRLPDLRTTRGREFLRQSSVAFVIGCFTLLPAVPAFAHGGGDSSQSTILVLDALSYLANQPPHYADLAMDKVKDALMAKDQSGVNLGPLALAKKALDAGQMMQARELLQNSLQHMMGQEMGQGMGQVTAQGMGQVMAQVMGDEPGTTMMLDPLKGSTIGGGSHGLLVGGSGLAVLAGLVLAGRWRPTQSLRKLRSQLTSESAL
jgi:hypothetical protein